MQAAQPTGSVDPEAAPVSTAGPPAAAAPAGFGSVLALPCLSGCVEPPYVLPNSSVRGCCLLSFQNSLLPALPTLLVGFWSACAQLIQTRPPTR